MTQFPDLFAALAAPFGANEVKVRQQAGRNLRYITARTAANRLDDVLGPESWHDDYVPGENSVMCRLSIRLPNGEWITKADAGGYAGMADSGDDDKSGFSDAFKRACAKFGIARYLYGDGVPAFVRERGPAGAHDLPSQGHAAPTDGGHGSARHPAQGEANGHHGGQEPRQGGQGGGKPFGDKAPKTGRALFAWTKEMEQKHEVGLLKYLNQWSALQDFPGRMVDWGAEQVALAHAEAVRKLQSVGADRGDAFEEAISN